jgi:hypothetical protein
MRKRLVAADRLVEGGLMGDSDVWQLRNLIAVLALIGAAVASWMLWGLWACIFTACVGIYLSMVGGLLVEAIQIRKP